MRGSGAQKAVESNSFVKSKIAKEGHVTMDVFEFHVRLLVYIDYAMMPAHCGTDSVRLLVLLDLPHFPYVVTYPFVYILFLIAVSRAVGFAPTTSPTFSPPLKSMNVGMARTESSWATSGTSSTSSL